MLPVLPSVTRCSMALLLALGATDALAQTQLDRADRQARADQPLHLTPTTPVDPVPLRGEQWLGSGTATLRGALYVKVDLMQCHAPGERINAMHRREPVTGKGLLVYLVPATPYNSAFVALLQEHLLRRPSGMRDYRARIARGLGRETDDTRPKVLLADPSYRRSIADSTLDEYGRFTFEGVPDGQYYLWTTIEKPCSQTHTVRDYGSGTDQYGMPVTVVQGRQHEEQWMMPLYYLQEINIRGGRDLNIDARMVERDPTAKVELRELE